MARQGQTLNANQQAPIILRIADLSTMTVQTQVSEADVGRLENGMRVYFTTLGGQGRRWHSALQKVEPTPVVQNNVVLYNALFDVPNPNRTLMTQMTAQVFFVVAEAQRCKTPLEFYMARGAAEPRRWFREIAAISGGASGGLSASRQCSRNTSRKCIVCAPMPTGKANTTVNSPMKIQ